MKKRRSLLVVLVMVMVGGGLTWWRNGRPPPAIPVGVVAWLASGAVVGSSEMNGADLFLEEHPHSRIRVVPLDDEWKPERSVPVIQDALRQGVRFFVSTHPSRCAVASMHLFAAPAALLIVAASTTPALTGRDDSILRLIPDAEQEQRAIARRVDQLPGNRILVLQDAGNLAYTEPAFASFAAALGTGRWQLVHRRLTVAQFKPEDYRALMAEPYDALYILAGTFQSAIGNMAQLFHYFHPEAPILLTPWARSPAILETAGDALGRIVLPSPYPFRHEAPALDDYLQRFRVRFGYEAHAMAIGVRQALELLDQAFARGYETPAEVKRYLLAVPVHQTSFGPVSFDRNGDVTGTFHFSTDLKQER